MNQPALPPLRCPTCTGSNITFSTYVRVESSNRCLGVAFEASDRAGYSGAAYAAERSRICLDCGFVLMFIKPESLAELRQRIGSLKPDAGRD